MATTEFVMPKLAMGMNEGTVQEWLVQDGDLVDQGQTLATVETEKVAYELEAPQTGYFKKLVEVETTVPVETPIAVFADTAEELDGVEASAAASATEAAPEAAESSPATPAAGQTAAPQALTGGRIKASPLARKMAADRGMDLASIQGTGPEGRICKRDILRAETSGEGLARGAAIPVAAAGLVEKARVPLAGIRAAIADNMMRQMHGTATITLYHQADVTDLLQARRQMADRHELLGTKVSVNAFFIKAIASAARRFPILNASIAGEEIVIWESVNVGFALALPSGDGYTENLMVPVIRNADRLSLSEVDLEMKRLIALGQEGKLSAADMADSTITFTTVAGIAPDGAFGNAIINGANACIVGIGGAKRQPAEYLGDIALRDLSPVVVNYDHRIVDGAPAGRFLSYLSECLQTPTMIMA